MEFMKKVWNYNTPYLTENSMNYLPNYKFLSHNETYLNIYLYKPIGEFIWKYTNNWSNFITHAVFLNKM